MPDTRVHLEKAQNTLLMTLYLRACDAGARQPILGDPFARDVLRRIDYPFWTLAGMRGNTPIIAARARELDRRVQAFLAEHPDPVVLHLACGLDSRPFRIGRPAGVDWFDVDYPAVMELRARLYDPAPGVHPIASSVTEADWWREIPTGRPTLVVAEGLLMYLAPPDVHTLLDRALALTDTLRLEADVVRPALLRIAGRNPYFRRADTGFRWGVADPREIERDHPRLRVHSAVSLVELARQHRPSPGYRAMLRAAGAIPGVRDAIRLLSASG